MKLEYIISAMMLLFCVKGFAQSNPRMENENYMYTVFYDYFDTPNLDRSKWNVSHDGKKTCGIWVDGANTLNQANSCLNLSIIASPGYTITDGLGHTYTADYISSEVTSSVTPFLHGSFECRAKYANQRGSWPAFWLFGGDGVACPPGGNACEIDISEFWSYTELMKPEDGVYCMDKMKLENNCHRYYPPLICGVDNFEHWYNALMASSMDNNFHVYKCVWTPEKIDFYMDNVLKSTALKASYNPDYFPYLPLSVKLSQQVNCLNCGTIVAPQTSSFDYVKVKQFFLAPEITFSNNLICYSGTATIDVDAAATNITWQLTPSNLFTTASGSGKVATMTRASGVNGQGKITYSFQMPSGETFTAEKNIYVGSLPTPYIPTSIVHCGTEVNFIVDELNTTYGTSFSWSSDILSISNNTSPQCTAWGTYDGTGYISCTVTTCGVSKTGTTTVRVNACDYLLFTPNPATNETTVSLESATQKSTIIASGWDVEVYDQGQLLKIKKTRLTARTTTLNTSDWKEGVYIVRAKVGDEVITEKLLVKH